MLVNYTCRHPKLKKNLHEQVRKPFTIKEQIKLGSVGSPKLSITKASVEINNSLILDNNLNRCNIEFRPKDVLVGFGICLETYLLAIPFYKLTLYKRKAKEYSIYKDNYFIKFYAKSTDTKIHQYVKKIINYKAYNRPTCVEDL
ncbi:hypothetical protein [uncultured Aquimarina sp.]|uniref:hypothetical protein n=1 Tax=uncultured Aquimarina sp. TaxID=575652 RepID=UPI00260896A2|nr:hypothetical protein [uncultured Aquimarina sp.]